MAKRGHGEEEILRVLREAESGDTVVEVCRKVLEKRGLLAPFRRRALSAAAHWMRQRFEDSDGLGVMAAHAEGAIRNAARASSEVVLRIWPTLADQVAGHIPRLTCEALRCLQLSSSRACSFPQVFLVNLLKQLRA